MMVTAIGPQKAERDSGIIARMAARAVSTTGQGRRRLDDGGPPVMATVASVGLDLIDEDDGVAHDHAGERDEAEQRDEAEGHA